jgi:WD40 repeat protein
VVTASIDRTARIWDARTGAALATLGGHGDVVVIAGFSPDGTRVATASIDRTTRIWDARTGAALSTLKDAAGASFSPDGASVVTASADRTARIWDARTGLPLATFGGHGDMVWTASFSPDGTRLVTASLDHTARVWEISPALKSHQAEQVRKACEHLQRIHAPLAFTKADMERYPVLKGEPVDPTSGDLVSPCRDVFP